MTTSALLEHFESYHFLTRDLLYYFVRRKYISFNKLPRGKGWTRDFPPEEIEKLRLRLTDYDLKKGMKTSRIRRDDSDVTEPARPHLAAGATSEGRQDPTNSVNFAEAMKRAVGAIDASIRSLGEPVVWPPRSSKSASTSDASTEWPNDLIAPLLSNRHAADCGDAKSVLSSEDRQALDRAMREIVLSAHKNRTYYATVQEIAAQMQSLFCARAVGLFLSNSHDADEMVLDAAMGAPGGTDGRYRRRFLNRDFGASDPDFNRPGLITNVFSAEGRLRSPLLPDTSIYAVLRIGIRDPIGRFVGRLEVLDRLSQDLTAGPIGFSERDINLANAVSSVIAHLIQRLKSLQALTRIIQMVQQGQELQKVLDEALWNALRLTGADRGDIALLSEARDDVVIVSQRGESALLPGKAIPEESVVSRLFRSQTVQVDLIDDVRCCKYYYNANGFVRSEVAVKFVGGVLNLESIHPRFFGQLDIEVLQVFAAAVAVAVRQLSGSKPALQVTTRADKSEDWNGLLAPAVEAVVEESESAILWVCDSTRRLLSPGATAHCEQAAVNPAEVVYHYDETALAAKVLRDRAPYFTMHPYNDPCVHHVVAKKFGIQGPLLALPLLFGKDVVGVLVVWRRIARAWTKHDVLSRLKQLDGLAPLLAICLQKLQSDHRKSLMMGWLYKMLADAQIAPDVSLKLRCAINTLVDYGFDRVRLLLWDAEKRLFIGHDSAGMRNPEFFVGLEIDPQCNGFAQDMVAAAFSNPEARKYEPTNYRDPDAKRLEKDEELAWACVPLVMNGKLLFGQIACDRARSGCEITAENLEFLTWVGAFVSHILMGQSAGELSVGKLTYKGATETGEFGSSSKKQ